MEREHCTVLAKAAKTPWRIWQLKEQSRKLWPFFQIGPNALRCEVAFSAPESVETTSESLVRKNFSTDFSSFFLKHRPCTVGCHSENLQGTVLVERCRGSAEPVQVIAANYFVIPMCSVGCGRAMGNQNYQILSDICGKL